MIEIGPNKYRCDSCGMAVTTRVLPIHHACSPAMAEYHQSLLASRRSTVLSRIHVFMTTHDDCRSIDDIEQIVQKVQDAGNLPCVRNVTALEDFVTTVCSKDKDWTVYLGGDVL